MQEYLDFAIALSLQAGAIIRAHFDKRLAITIKSDLSPVTEVDIEINRLVIKEIKHTYPEHGILAEEANHGNGTERWQWLCDPLDGTRPYILGAPQSVFMLALLLEGELCISVVYDPYLDKLYYATKDGGAFCNGTPICVSRQRLEQGCVLLDNSSFGCLEALKALGGTFEQMAGTGYKCMMVACGKAVGFMNHKADFHDIGPAALIIQEAGGKVTSAEGQPLTFNSEITTAVVSNGQDHERLLAIARTAE
jgi:myo-inositol-1(or 4)-monophosphatase